MPRRTNFTSQPYLSPTHCAAAEWACPAALAQLWRQVWNHDIPNWGPNCVIWVLNLADGEFRDVPIVALLALLTLPFHVSYPVLTLLQLALHDCIHWPQINFPEDSGNPPYKFHLAPPAKSHPSSDAKLSSSSLVAELQSSHHSLASSSSAAKLQPSSRYNYHNINTSNPHSPGLDNWQSNRSSDRSSDSYIDRPSDNSSDLTPPGLIPGRAMGPSEKEKKAATQASMILGLAMARSHRAAAAAVHTTKDRQFKAFQEELGLLLDNDGEALALSTPQKAAAWCPVA
jgi:hypothetical protein